MKLCRDLLQSEISGGILGTRATTDKKQEGRVGRSGGQHNPRASISTSMQKGQFHLFCMLCFTVRFHLEKKRFC